MHPGRPDADPRRRRAPHGRLPHELRCRARLPLPVLLLHHHQCAGPKVPPAVARRHRGDHSANLAQGLSDFFITDDNFARNKDWEAILDRLIYLRRVERKVFFLTIQVDTLCHRIPRFIEKCALAGVKTAFIGLENINPANLVAAKKRQNKITEYRKLLLAMKNLGILTYAGYILGFPHDTKESILHDLEVIKRELPLELLEMFYLTPLPGSEDHQKLHRAGTPMDPDINKYDLNHRVTGHARMTPQEWDEAYKEAWAHYYTFEHIETILRRAAASRGAQKFRVNLGAALINMTWFKGAIDIEDIHPLETGLFRLKYRRDRRPGRGIEPAWSFYPKLFAETLVKSAKWAGLVTRMGRIYWRVVRDPKRHEYMDAAITPVTDHERRRRARCCSPTPPRPISARSGG